MKVVIERHDPLKTHAGGMQTTGKGGARSLAQGWMLNGVIDLVDVFAQTFVQFFKRPDRLIPRIYTLGGCPPR